LGEVVQGGFGGKGTGEVIALEFGGADAWEQGGEAGVLDSFDDGFEFEGLAEVEDGDEDAATAWGSGLLDEAHIDLHLVEGEVGDHVEGGMTGAEVVEGEAEAGIVEGMEGMSAAGVLEEGLAFGGFEDDAMGWEAVMTGQLAELFGIGGVEELSFGDIEGEIDGETGGLPFGQLPEGLFEDLPAEFGDQAAGFGDGDEMGRGDPAELVIVPAGEGFEGADGAGAGVNDGLVVDLDTVLLEGFGEAGKEVAATDQGVGTGGGMVIAPAIAAGTFGFGEGVVHAFEEQAAGIGVVGEPGEAEAEGDVEIEAEALEAFFDPADHLFVVGFRFLRSGPTLEEDQESVAGFAAHGIAGGAGILEDMGEGTDDLVAGAVTVGLVEFAEVVDVDFGEGGTGMVEAGVVEGGGESIGEEGAMGEAGEHIVAAHLGGAGFGGMGWGRGGGLA
jgi:hypothetical protein